MVTVHLPIVKRENFKKILTAVIHRDRALSISQKMKKLFCG